MLKLGYSKKLVMDTSIKQFLRGYERIGNINLNDSVGLDEIANLKLDKQDMLSPAELRDIYESSLSSGVAGAAAGTALALAANGALASTGAALAAGNIGGAAAAAGSALSFGAALSPALTLAAPVLLFTGISSSMEADANLEKAKTMYAEAGAAIEKMRTAEIMCTAIRERSDMFNDLLAKLNEMFSRCAYLLDGVTLKKTSGFFKAKTVDYKDLTAEEKNLAAVTGALAKAVKTVIDTPILNENGDLTEESYETCRALEDKLNDYKPLVEKVESYNLPIKKPRAIKPKKLPKAESSQDKSKKKKTFEFGGISGTPRNILSIVGAWLLSGIAYAINENLADIYISLIFTGGTLLFMEREPNGTVFKVIRYIFCFLFGCCLCSVYYTNFWIWINLNHFWTRLIVYFFIFGIVCGVLPKFIVNISESASSMIVSLGMWMMGCVLSLALFRFLIYISLSVKAAYYIALTLCFICSLVAAFNKDLEFQNP